MNNRTRLNRLYRLRSVVELHKGAQYAPVKLNGVERRFDMHSWDCGTGACALGSYALTPYGRRHFIIERGEIENTDTGASDYYAGADHFGISREESRWLFIPDEYDVAHMEPISPSKVIKRIDTIIRRYERGEGDKQGGR